MDDFNRFIELFVLIFLPLAIIAAITLPFWLRYRERCLDREQRLAADEGAFRAELDTVKSRLANVERIVTDDGHRLTQEIDSLRSARN